MHKFIVHTNPRTEQVDSAISASTQSGGRDCGTPRLWIDLQTPGFESRPALLPKNYVAVMTLLVTEEDISKSI